MKDLKVQLVKRVRNGKVVWFIVLGTLAIFFVGSFIFVKEVVADKITCKSLEARGWKHWQAQALFDSAPKFFSKLDGDKDNIACEALK